MGKRKEDKDVEVVETVKSPVQPTTVTVHLDRDLNDPRNKPPKKALPSLDD